MLKVWQIAGGTGITPFYQLLQYLSAQTEIKPDLTLIYASASPSEVLLRQELEDAATKYQGKTIIRWLVDQSSDKSKLDKVGRLSTSDLSKWLGDRQRKTLAIVCGPEGMVDAVAGPRPRSRDMRGVRGMLGELGWHENEVRRL